MSVKIRVNGIPALVRQLKKMRQDTSAGPRAARVFYTAPHAVPVHEDWPENRRPTQFAVGGPKFLETPMRAKKGEIAALVYETLKKGFSLGEALLRAARFLREESQKVCPVDTGELRDSAGERLEN